VCEGVWSFSICTGVIHSITMQGLMCVIIEINKVSSKYGKRHLIFKFKSLFLRKSIILY
jgi:hypothetical protein